MLFGFGLSAKDKSLSEKVKELEISTKELASRNQSLDRTVDSLTSEFKILETQTKAMYSAVWEYGSAWVGVFLGLIIAFGILSFIANRQTARLAFEDGFSNYETLIKQKLKRASDLVDELETRLKSMEEGDKQSKNPPKAMTDKYGS
jgi:hypothetical protein